MNMKRREFSRFVAGTAVVSAVWTPVGAQGAKPVAGQDFQVLDPRVPVEAPAGKVEVVEFFSYMCPHCNVFEPTLAAWIKRAPKDVVVRRAPVGFLPDFEVLQRMYFALEALKMVDKLQAQVFAAIHVEHRAFSKPDIAADWVAQQGVDRAKFMEQFQSFAVANKATRASQLANAYKIDGVPAIGVAGRFLTEGTARGLQIVEWLVAEARTTR
jgi:thiol:disulfide interchange protein DsbA